jgi:hypothetical protein
MTPRTKSILFWVFSFIFMACIAIYQRMTGPTHPVRGHITLSSEKVDFKLLTSSDAPGDQKIYIIAKDTSIKGNYRFKRFKSKDEWTVSSMMRKGDSLLAFLPHQAPAGKVMYDITLNHGTQAEVLTKQPVVMRYKGPVPGYILYPHILFMFLAMVFSTRAGVESLAKGAETYWLSWATTIFLFAGGVILGPIVQKYAFGAFWTGWPFGHDLTDNKTAVALLAWVMAIITLSKNREKRGWALAAAIILLAVYLIPHSVLGSEIDYTKP